MKIPWTRNVLILSILAFAAMAVGATVDPAAPKSTDAVAAYKKYDEAVAVAKGELVKALEAALDKATKAGDLDEALRIRDKVRELKKVPATAAATELVEKPFVATVDLVGLWRDGANESIQFAADGTCAFTANNVKGTWKCTDKSLVLTWSNGMTDTYSTRDGLAVSGTNQNGLKLTIRKNVVAYNKK